MIKQKIIIANWKMNPQTLAEAKMLLRQVQSGLQNDLGKKIVVFCPPFVFLSGLKQILLPGYFLGSQDVFYAPKGAFTGEVSPAMLKQVGCRYVIIGHSERRQYLNETDEMINKKNQAALKAGLKPILCIGEKQKEIEGISEILKNQLTVALKEAPSAKIRDLIITYEPVWAISTTPEAQACLPDDVFSAGLFIRKVLAQMFGYKSAQKIPVLYGGSVNSKNAASYIIKAHFDGLLVGGASLKAEEFVKIVISLSD